MQTNTDGTLKTLKRTNMSEQPNETTQTDQTDQTNSTDLPVVAIVGTGLIGASLGLALQEHNQSDRILGMDASAKNLNVALDKGAITETITADGIRDADYVFVAVPPKTLPHALAAIAPFLKRGAIISDVTSTKEQAVTLMEAILPINVNIIGGHPMAGSHDQGPEHAVPDMFVAALWLLTPTRGCSKESIVELSDMLTALGSKVIDIDPHEHDQLVAIISHLPQMAATTLMSLASERAHMYKADLMLMAAGGFRDTTRIAASNPEMWIDIVTTNRDAIVNVLDEFNARIGQLRMMIYDQDFDRLHQLLTKARASRKALPGKVKSEGDWYEFRIAIPDRPGSLAMITALMGDNNINIEDFGISHSPEGARGRLRMTLIGEDNANRASTVLTDAGFNIHMREI